MADIPSIGAHCSVTSCNVNDFLPMRCRCDQLFCKDHISPESHSCPVDPAAKESSEPAEKLQRCALDKCSKPSLEAFVSDNTNTSGRIPAVCHQCRLSYCAIHRDPSSHSCSGETAQPANERRNEAAHALLVKHFLSKQDATTTTVVNPRPIAASSNPKKAAQIRQVELMKMRHHAQPADPKDKSAGVPISERLHLKVTVDGSNSIERLFWLRKTIGAGRAIDLLAKQLGVSTSSPLHLLKVGLEDGENVRIATDQLLATQVEDGAPVILSR
ncbi:hypothetical protein CERSUDRAFT_159056 [Gelatoporia subvermispora B]|uniref:AN1-type domain-containing protein n=1 Tax=Ceriporiopsis subvermispora (strain B) TaxID=914234 RepID=M2QC02_CERS8|nr:hypothetical protein CERSUDRAFT_159056 [Gelatoporia subvermispora B]